MPGVGTDVATKAARDFPVLLDITRLVSRVGYSTLTGVDRVEFAYLKWCLATPKSLFGIVRIASGYALLNRRGLSNFLKRFDGEVDWGKRDARAIIGIKTPKPRARAESDIRRIAIDLCKQNEISHMVAQSSLGDHVYLNTGHSNISGDLFGALAQNNFTTAVFLHDVIPLEHPTYQREGAALKFEKKIAIMNTYADMILVNSEDTKMRAKPYFEKPKNFVVSHLGIEAPRVQEPVLRNNRPYFVAIGTIEPRKNHTLLIDVWDQLQAELGPKNVPKLHVVGQPGWNNDTVLQKLHALESHDPIKWHKDLQDDALWDLLAGANALLFPSLAEGFGLPSLEAASLGTSVICGDLAIHRELLGSYPVYLNPQDTYLWKKTILEQTQATEKPQRQKPHIPTWDEHFARVNRAISNQG